MRIQFIPCRACQSEGRTLTSNGSPDNTDWGECPYCNGAGEEEIELELASEEEIMEAPSC